VALNDNATLVVGTGNYLTAVTGTALPTDLTVPGIAWENVGHTSLDSIFGISSDGGDATVDRHAPEQEPADDLRHPHRDDGLHAPAVRQGRPEALLRLERAGELRTAPSASRATRSRRPAPSWPSSSTARTSSRSTRRRPRFTAPTTCPSRTPSRWPACRSASSRCSTARTTGPTRSPRWAPSPPEPAP
jgi:hypothetical protein